MDKRTKIILFIIFIMIAILLLCVSFMKNEENTTVDNRPTNQTNNIENSNTEVDIEQNGENQTAESEVDTEGNETQNIENEENTEGETTQLTDEQKIIEYVKNDWGTSEGVYFTIENINSDETYVVSVRDSSTTISLKWYTVDLKKGIVK